MGMGVFGDAGGAMPGGLMANMAVGRIVIDTSSIASARTVVVREAKLMGDSLRQVGDRTDQGVTQATGALKRLDNSLENSRQRASLLVAALVTGGVAAAQSVKSLEMRMVALSGSEEQAAEHMETLRKQAAAAGQPFLSLVEGATGLLPALRGTNADLGQTVMLAQRLAMMDPAQGVAGASFAIREFLNGEYISLTRRLELDRTRLREILAEADGDAQKAIDGLSRYIDEIGISEQQLMDMGKEGAYAFQVLRDEAKQTMAEAFTPFLNDVLIPIFRTLNDILRAARQVSPELLGIAGTAAGLYGTAAVAQRGLPIIGSIPGGARIAKGAVAAGSLYVGSQIGAGAVRLAGNVGVPGFGRFEGASQGEALSTLTDTMKQIGVILLSGFANIAKHAIMAGFTLRNAFEVVVAGLELGAALLGNGFADAAEAIAKGAKAIAGVFADFLGNFETIDFNFGTIDLGEKDLGPLGKIDFGEIDLNFGKVETGVRGTVDALRRYEESLTTFDDALRTSDDTMQNLHDTVRRGFDLTIEQQKAYQLATESLDVLVLEFGRWTGVIDEGTRSLAAFETQFFGTMVDGMKMAFDAIRPTQPDIKITDELLEEWAAFQDELADIDRAEKEDLREEERRYRADALKETQQYNENVAREVERYNERVAGVEANYAAERVRAAESYNERVADAEESYAESRARALENMQLQEAEIRAGLAERVAEAEASHQVRAVEFAVQYAKRREDIEEQFNERMLQIQRQARRDIARAAMRLDGEGIWTARQRMKDQQKDEQNGFEKRLEDLDEWLRESQKQEEEAYQDRLEEAQRAADKQLTSLRDRYQREEREARQSHDKQLADLRTRYQREEQLARENRAAQLSELAMQHQRELAEMQTAHSNELVQLRTTHLLRMGEIQRQAAAERAAVETAFINTFNALQVQAGAHQSVMIGIQQQGQAVMEAELRAWWSRMQGVISSAVVPQAPIMQSPYQWVPPGGRYINPFQTGGRAHATGPYRLEQGEYVLRPDVAKTIDQMLGGNLTQGALLSALSGRGGHGDVQVSGMTIPISVEMRGGAREAAQDVGAAVEAKFYELLVELGA